MNTRVLATAWRFFQDDDDVLISSLGGKYPDITAAEYLQRRISANFSNKY